MHPPLKASTHRLKILSRKTVRIVVLPPDDGFTIVPADVIPDAEGRLSVKVVDDAHVGAPVTAAVVAHGTEGPVLAGHLLEASLTETHKTSSATARRDALKTTRKEVQRPHPESCGDAPGVS